MCDSLCMRADIMLTEVSAVILSSQLLSYSTETQNKIISNRVRADYFCPTLNISSYYVTYSYIILIFCSAPFTVERVGAKQQCRIIQGVMERFELM